MIHRLRWLIRWIVKNNINAIWKTHSQMHPLNVWSWQSRCESYSSCCASLFPLIFPAFLSSRTLDRLKADVLPAWLFWSWFPSHHCFGHFKLESFLKKCQMPWKQTQLSCNGLDRSPLVLVTSQQKELRTSAIPRQKGERTHTEGTFQCYSADNKHNKE